MTPEQLKMSILQYAIQGKLVEQREEEGTAETLIVELKEAKENLIKSKVIKKEKDIEDKEIELPFEIPETWEWISLGNSCEIYTGNSISESIKKTKYTGISEGLDYIATKDITFDNTVVYNNGVKIPIRENFRIAKAGSILMCIEGGSAGKKIGIIDKDVCFGNKLCMFNSKVINNKYIYYYFQSNEFKCLFFECVSGIIGGVSIKKLKNLPIPIPPLEEQHRIIAKIDELLPLVDKYTVAYIKLEQLNKKFPEDLKKSILQYAIQGKLVEQRAEEGIAEELYEQIQKEKEKLIKEKKIKKEKPLTAITDAEIPFDIPKSWKWVRFGKCGCFERGSGIKKDEVVPAGKPCIRYGQLYTTYKTRFSEVVSFVTQELFEKCHKIEQGNILMALTGENEYDIALAVTYEGVEEIAMGGDMTRFFNHFMNPLYLTYVINSQYGISCKSKMASGNIIVHISNDKLATIPIPLPPLEEQHRIVAKIEELLPLCDKLIK